VLFEKFLNWLSEGWENDSAQQPPKRPLLAAPKAPRQITQRSLPSPQSLFEIAAEYGAKQQRLANEQYDAFLDTGYPNFIQWVESLVEKSATFGSYSLFLTFDNSTGIATASTSGPHQVLTPNSYALPISPSTLQKLAATAGDHFQKADFAVRLGRQEGTFLLTHAQPTASYDCLEILWAESALHHPYER
jgi:hypothetical protein